MGGKKKRRKGFLFGALVGGTIGLLFAPKSGKETRAQLMGEGGLGDQLDRVKRAVGAGKDSVAGQSDQLKRKLDETRERLRHEADVVDAAGPAAGA